MVYIIDDNQSEKILLKSAGSNSICIESVNEFLKKFEPGENDLLILDMHMPQSNNSLPYSGKRFLQANIILNIEIKIIFKKKEK
ncbi:MAG: hypothetical protein ACM34O_04920 [Ignavibacteria bacterium]